MILPKDLSNYQYWYFCTQNITTREGDKFIVSSKHERIGDFERIFEFSEDGLVIVSIYKVMLLINCIVNKCLVANLSLFNLILDHEA